MKESLRNTVDIGDVIQHLENLFGEEQSQSQYFYFYEECQDTGVLIHCETYEEVLETVVKQFIETKEGLKMTKKPKFFKEVNELVDALVEKDDFNMKYKNVKSNITDDSRDLANVTIDGKVVCEYSYSGPRYYPTFVNEFLIFEALEVLKS